MAGLADIGGPWALLGLAQGLLAPGPTSGARFSQGLAGMQQGYMQNFQLQRMQEQLAKTRELEDAFKRMADPTAYDPTITAEPQGPTREGPPLAPVTEPSKFSRMGDALRIAPEAVISAQMKAQFDPLGGLPPGIQELLYFAKNPELAGLKSQIDPTSPEALLRAAGIQPGTPRASEFLANRGRSQVMIENKQESAFEGAEGQRYSTQIYGPISAAAVNSNVNLQKIRRAKDLLSNFKSGAGAPLAGQLSSIAQTLGIDPAKLNLDKAGPKEAFASLSNDFILSDMERLKGVASDSDVKMLRAMQASVGGTPEGNLLILDAAERIWSRANEVNRIAQEHLSKSGGKPRGVEQAIEDYWRRSPLYSPDEAKNINTFLGQARTPGSPEAIKLMSLDELRQLDPAKLSREQADAMRLRLMMLTGGR